MEKTQNLEQKTLKGLLSTRKNTRDLVQTSLCVKCDKNVVSICRGSKL